MEAGKALRISKRTIHESLTLKILFVEFLDSCVPGKSLVRAVIYFGANCFPDQVFHYLLINLLVPESTDERIQEGDNDYID